MGPYLGDYRAGSIVYFTWDTNDGNGGSVNPTVAGTISVYKDDDVAQSVAGITDVRAFDGLVGIHNVKIDTAADAFYAAGHDYSVILSASTIDGQVVNATLACFSLDNRVDVPVSHQGTAQAGDLTSIQLAVTASAVNDYYNGSIIAIVSGLGAGQARLINGYVGLTTTVTVTPDWVTAPNNTSVYKIMPITSTSASLIADAVLDADLALHLGALIDNRTIGGILVQLRLSKYANVEMVRAVAAVPAQGITLPMATSGVIQYEIVRISLTRNFAAPDFLYYDLWRYNPNQTVVEVKASLGILW